MRAVCCRASRMKPRTSASTESGRVAATKAGLASDKERFVLMPESRARSRIEPDSPKEGKLLRRGHFSADGLVQPAAAVSKDLAPRTTQEGQASILQDFRLPQKIWTTA